MCVLITVLVTKCISFHVQSMCSQRSVSSVHWWYLQFLAAELRTNLLELWCLKWSMSILNRFRWFDIDSTFSKQWFSCEHVSRHNSEITPAWTWKINTYSASFSLPIISWYLSCDKRFAFVENWNIVIEVWETNPSIDYGGRFFKKATPSETRGSDKTWCLTINRRKEVALQEGMSCFIFRWTTLFSEKIVKITCADVISCIE